MIDRIEVPVAKENRVLVVEDEETVARYYSEILGQRFEVETVSTAGAAMDRLSAATPDRPKVDAILLDLILPNGRGEQLVTRFRRQFNIPIVVITAGDFERRRIIAAGAQEFLHKTDATQQKIINSVFDAIARHQVWGEYRELDQGLKAIKESSAESLCKIETALGRPPSSPSQTKRDKES